MLRGEPSRSPASVGTLNTHFTAVNTRSLTRAGDHCVRQTGPETLVRKLLVPTDFSAASNKAVKCGAALASQCNAALTILHVVDINSQVATGTAGDLMTNLWAQGSAQIAQLAGSLSGQVEVQTMLGEGLPWEVIVEKSRDFDLLVLGKKGGKRGLKIFSQRTTQRVVENAACPVMVMHQRS